MKGAKGGKRDRIISKLFSVKNAKIKDENNELDSKTTLKLNRQYINENNNLNSKPKEQIDIQIEEVIPPIKHEVPPTPTVTTTTETTRKNIDENNTKEQVITTEIKKEETELSEIQIDIEKIETKIPNEIFEESENKEEEIEVKIIDALEVILKEDLYELEELEYEFKVLNEKQDAEVDYEKIERLKEELQELLRKFEIIKEKYDFYKYSDKKDYIELDDKFIYDLIIEYKKETGENTLITQINEQVEKIEEYIGIIEKIITIEKDTDTLEADLDEKLEKYEIRDEEFERLKIEYENIDDINNLVDTFNRKQDEIIRDLEYKIETSEKITKDIETTTSYVTNFNRLIQMAILISMSKKIPPTPTGNILKTTLMLSAINAATNFITKKETSRVITKVKYTDYSKSIKKAMNDTSSIITKIDDAFIDIQTINGTFEKECEEYKDQIKDYDKLIKNLNKVEIELKEKQRIAKKYNNKFNKILNINNQKVKKLEELKAS